MEKNINESIDFENKQIGFEIISLDEDIFEFKTVQDFDDHPFKNDLTTYEVGIETKIVYGVIIKIFRK